MWQAFATWTYRKQVHDEATAKRNKSLAAAKHKAGNGLRDLETTRGLAPSTRRLGGGGGSIGNLGRSASVTGSFTVDIRDPNYALRAARSAQREDKGAAPAPPPPSSFSQRSGPPVLERKYSFTAPMSSSMLRVSEKKVMVLADVTPWYIILPQAPLRLFWDAVMTALIMYISLVEPFRIAFEFNDSVANMLSTQLTDFEYAIDCYFAVDICMNFFTAFPNDVGRLVVDVRQIAQSYASFWFAIDFVSTIPWDVFVLLATSASGNVDPSLASSLRLIRLLRLLRLARIFRLARVFARLEAPMEKIGIAEAVRSSSVVLVIILMAHWIACLFWLTTNAEGLVGSVPNATTDYERAWNGYFENHHLEYASSDQVYAAALYWSLMTLATIGYGDITPSTQTERIMTCAVMFVSSTVFAYFIGRISNLVADSDHNDMTFRQQMKELNEYMNVRRLPEDLKTRIRLFFQYRRTTKKFYDEDTLLVGVTKAMRAEVALTLYRESILAIPAFFDAPQNFVERVALALKTSYAAPTEIIYSEGEPAFFMNLLLQGTVQLMYRGTTRRRLINGRYFFGEEVFLNRDRGRESTAVSITYCDLAELDADDLDEILALFPRIRVKVRATALWGVIRRQFLIARVVAMFRPRRELDDALDEERRPAFAVGFGGSHGAYGSAALVSFSHQRSFGVGVNGSVAATDAPEFSGAASFAAYAAAAAMLPPPPRALRGSTSSASLTGLHGAGGHRRHSLSALEAPTAEGHHPAAMAETLRDILAAIAGVDARVARIERLAAGEAAAVHASPASPPQPQRGHAWAAAVPPIPAVAMAPHAPPEAAESGAAEGDGGAGDVGASRGRKTSGSVLDALAEGDEGALSVGGTLTDGTPPQPPPLPGDAAGLGGTGRDSLMDLLDAQAREADLEGLTAEHARS